MIHRGYKDNEQETASTMFEDGWLRTGDLGYIDDHGYLTVYDRIKDLIKYKGWVTILRTYMSHANSSRFQVAPSELENLLIRHPLVREAAVIGIWSEKEATEIPRAFVVLKEPVQPSAMADVSKSIADFVATQVSTYKRLRGGVVIIKELPKNTTGKVLKKALKDEELLDKPVVSLARL